MKGTRSPHAISAARSRRIALFTAALLAIGLISHSGPQPSAEAASGSQFQAGNIISDQNFFNNSAMTQDQIQGFFRAISCSPRNGVPCLANYTQTTASKPAQGAGHCSQYDGAPNESAAQIVWRVAQVCRISPAVLLVLMQKEQSMITSPSAYGYERTMGFACPDTAACDPQYFGFFNQVYKAAWQFRQYTQTASKWRYRIGSVSIQWHPNADCGSSVVNIENQATANLYNYTPYQPNSSALENLYGLGNSCSSYGNRNFWRIYSDWFGSPQDPPGTPVGEVKQLWATPGQISFWGWVYDDDAAKVSIPVHVKIGDAWYVVPSNASNGTANILYPGAGDLHGFGASIPVAPGLQTICIYGVNQGRGSNLLMNCSQIDVPSASPQGEVKEVWGGVNSISMWGWAVDPDLVSSSTDIHVSIDSSWAVLTANQPYPGLESKFPESPSNHGFGGAVQAPPGDHEVCIFAVNKGLGANTVLKCSTVTVFDGSPVGQIKELYPVVGGVSLWGWAADTDALGVAADINVRIDGSAWYVYKADQNYAPPSSVRGAKPNLGFGATIPLSVGSHEVCVIGANIGGGSNVLLGCRTIYVAGGSPVGAVNGVFTEAGRIGYWGWGLDPDTKDPLAIHALLDGAMWSTTEASAANSIAQAAYPAFGPNRGFGAFIPTATGAHNLCLFGVNKGAGVNLSLGCWNVNVP